MSNHIISMAYKRDLRTPMRKSVMILLADKASDDGSGIWASKQTMADELCCSKQTVIDTMQQFVADGLLKEVGQRKNPNGYTMEYSIIVPALEALDLVACHARRGSARLTSQADLPVNLTDLTSQPAGPKPSKYKPPNNIKRESAVLLPSDWQPSTFTSGTKSAEIVKGWTPDDLVENLERFVAHHRAKGSKFKSWQDAWSTWVLNSKKFGSAQNVRSNQTRSGGKDQRSSLARVLDDKLSECDDPFDGFPTTQSGEAGEYPIARITSMR